MLIAGGMLLLAGTLTAQKQLPVSISPLAQQWLAERTPKAFTRLQQFSQPVRPANKVVVDRGGASVLDSAVLFTGYAWGDSFPQSKAVFNYPNATTAIQTEYEYLGGWQLQSRTTQKSDSQGRTIELYAESWDAISQNWVSDSRLLTYPHGTSTEATDSLLAELWDPQTNEWLTVLYNATSYDDQDRPVIVINYLNESGFTFALLDELYYDANGDNYYTDQSVFEQGAWTLFSRIEREFVQHREVRNTTYGVIDPTTLVATNKLETAYDGNGNAVLEEAFDADFFTGEWTLNERTTRTFDNVHRVYTETYEDLGFDAPPASQTTYVYQNPSGPELALDVYAEKDVNTQEWVIQEKTYYYFGNTTAAPEVRNGEALELSPNPTTGLVRFSTTNAVLPYQVLNVHGQVVVPAGQTENGQVDLSGLPSGLYYITVQEGAVRRTGKVVKQ